MSRIAPTHGPARTTGHWYLLVVSLLHVVLVLTFMRALGYEPRNDSLRYLHVAREFREFRLVGADPDMNCHTAPGYPLFLAAIHPVTHDNKYLVAIVQAVVLAFSLHRFINALVRSSLLKKELTPWAFTFPLVLPDVIHMNGWLLSESLTTSLLLITVAGTLQRPRGTWPFIAWIAAASMLVFTKFEYLVVVTLLIAVMVHMRRRYDTGLIILSLSVLLALNGWRNHLTFGRFNPFSFGAGTVIYGGNNMNGDGSWHIAETNPDYLPEHGWEQFRSIAMKDRTTLCLEEDALYKRSAWEAWQEAPGLQLRMIPLKFMKLWLLPADLDIYTSDNRFTPGLRLGTLFNDRIWPTAGIIKHATEVALLWTAMALIMIGAWQGRRGDGHRYGWLLWGVAAVLTALYALPFYGLGRFHVPMLVLLSVHGVPPLRGLFHWAARPHGRRLSD